MVQSGSITFVTFCAPLLELIQLVAVSLDCIGRTIEVPIADADGAMSHDVSFLSIRKARDVKIGGCCVL